ncbi:MAG: hypothetical protein V3T23_02965, partial [Nitrososphaerales archaeon]
MEDAITAYEALDLILSATDQFDSIFGYWISVSFAVIVGIFVARDQLNLALTSTIGILYLVACIMFAIRFISVQQLISEVTTH